MTEGADRRYATGAEVKGGGVSFRVWAPERRRVALVLRPSGDRHELAREPDGHWSAFVPGLAAGARYVYRLDDVDYDYPDPASRSQPDGVHGPSEVVDGSAYPWTDHAWRGRNLPGQVIYELHIGCFTPEGTYRAAEQKLAHLAETGVTVLEVMPLSEFDGDFGWGYDGVFWYAPTRAYGTPDDLRHFVDAAHGHGLSVILDVVYNHFGPTGNYTGAFSPHWVSRKHHTDWGDAINYDGEHAEHVRRFVTENAAYWISEFHFDGFRFDATQAIYDDSPTHLLAEVNQSARAAAGDRALILVAENESQDVRHVDPPEKGGFGLDGLWNDDFHHTARVAATGHAEFYYSDYAGSPQELLGAAKWGYLFQGQFMPRRKHRRGTPAWQAPGWRFVNCLQNHDQVSNSAHGKRLQELSSPGRYRALTTLMLLAPGTPMLFMGQEFACTMPFLYFADHPVDLAQMVREGRFEYLRRFPRVAGWEGSGVKLPDPSDVATFQKSKLDWSERDRHASAWQLHRDLLTLRRTDAMFSRQDKTVLHGAVIGPEQFLLRWLDDRDGDRLLLVNLGRDYPWHPSAEPLIAPPEGATWTLLFSSDDERYGGSGTALLDTTHWHVPGHAAIALAPQR